MSEEFRQRAPAMQWYVADWLNDAALKLCSLYARGLWAELLMVMWQAEPQGHLAIKGKPYTVAQIARVVREPEKPVAAALAELEDAGVYSKDAHGVIFSRRMVRDVAHRKVRAEGGKLGGNPALTGGRKVNLPGNLPAREVNLPGNLPAETEDKQKPTPSVSFSSSASTSVNQRDIVVVSASAGENDDDDPGMPTQAAQPPADAPLKADDVAAAWNEAVAGTPLPPLEFLTAKRRKAAQGLADWFSGTPAERRTAIMALFRLLAASEYCCGAGRDGWKASFEWACDVDNAAEVLEGRFFEVRKTKGGRR